MIKHSFLGGQYTPECTGQHTPDLHGHFKPESHGHYDRIFHYNGENDFSELHKQFCDPSQPVTYVNGVRNHFRWEFMIMKNDFELTESELKTKYSKFLEAKVNLKDFEIIRSKRYTFHTIMADKWRSKRVFLAGDAAHLMPPFLGQGMCSGIKDAKNLAWKLKLATENWNSNTNKLLDSYQIERSTQVRKIIKLAAILGGFIQYSNPILAPFRNGILKFMNILPSKSIDRLIENHLYSISIPKGKTNKHHLVGKRFPQPKVINKFGFIYFDELLGFHWTLITKCKIILDKDLNNIMINHIHLTNNIPNKSNCIISDTIKTWFNHQKVDFVIIRPDKFISHAGLINDLNENVKHLINEINSMTSN
ncbi:MAG: FAD-dependent monooxygenase [Flavobacteriia bacterium]|nr:FAD-dependent monooxygenase [Flavobacteriia bacterium]